jgi:hypothetical protein
LGFFVGAIFVAAASSAAGGALFFLVICITMLLLVEAENTLETASPSSSFRLVYYGPSSFLVEEGGITIHCRQGQ